MKKYILIGVALTLAYSVNNSYGQIHKVKLVPLPIVYYSPETKLAVGGVLNATFKTTGDTLVKRSVFQTGLIYTLNDQFLWQSLTRLYLHENAAIIQARFKYSYFPEYYYGLNTHQPEAHKDAISYRHLELVAAGYQRINKAIYGGLTFVYRSFGNFTSLNNGPFFYESPPGSDGYKIFSMTPSFLYESRDSQIFPTRGTYLEFQMAPYFSITNGHYKFFRVNLEIRKYVRLNDNNIVAIQSLIIYNNGDVPFKEMAEFGGSTIMRGYYKGYFRFGSLHATQVEFRKHLWRVVRCVFWTGYGLTPSDFQKAYLKWNAGVGIRCILNTKSKEPISIRIDLGFGMNHQHGVYTDLGEAF